MIGVLLGLGAPIGSILLRVAYSYPRSFQLISDELNRNGYFYTYMAVATPVFFGLFGLAVGYLLDEMSRQKKTLENLNVLLKHQAVTDDLTGLYNRRHILSELEKELERASRYKHPFSGMMIDIDHFKDINDRYGHLTGDRLLREVASVLAMSIRKIDIVGRYGGDEFLVLLPEAGTEAARTVAMRIQKALSQYAFRANGSLAALFVSIGLTTLDAAQETDATAFVEHADVLLLSAKRAGKNRVVSG
jgi:diguanylate cyclase (GGDEF)-like protein